MGTLSNFLRRADAGPAAPIVCRQAERNEIHGAVRLILGAGGRAGDESAVLDFLQFAVHRGINLNDLWVAERAGRLIWSTLPIVSPGKTLLLLAPGGHSREPDVADPAGTLVDAVCEHFAARGFQLAQVLLDPADTHARTVYIGRSFREMAELTYLQVEIRRAIPAAALPEGFDWLTYSPAAHADFANTIVQSYIESLDCPSLNGLRDIEDVIVGHKASGVEFDPTLWLLLRERGEPVAALLLARTAAAGSTQEAAELVYLGLVPRARRRGLANIVLRHALHVVSSRRLGSLALAVDSGNAPALRLYHRHGMRRLGSKLAMMRELRTHKVVPSASTSPITT